MTFDASQVLTGTGGLTMGSNINLNSNQINNLPAPAQAADATNKTYVDGTSYITGGDGIDNNSSTIAVDSTVVRTTGTQTIAGAKTFSDNIILSGDLTVSGTTTTINSTTLTINDKNIVLADSAANAAAADGAGITINGASATLTYASAGDNWVFNKAPYYSSARLITTDDKLIDSALTTQLIDSAYILARAPEPDGDGLAFAIALG